MGSSRKTSTRTLRATKQQVAVQLRTLKPGLNGDQILVIAKSPDATFWQATITTGFTAFNGIEEKLDEYLEFDAVFLIEQLISAVDGTVTAPMILDVLISPTDSTKVEVILKRK